MCHKLLAITIGKLNSTISTINGYSGLCTFNFWNQSAFEVRCFSFVKVKQVSAECRLHLIVSLQLDCHRNWNIARINTALWMKRIRNLNFIDINMSISSGRCLSSSRCLSCCQIKCVNAILRNCKEGTIKMIAIIVFSRFPFHLK